MTETEFKRYLALGLCAPGVWGGQKDPIAYLYNGVRLPKLPEWDREKYPYAYIYHDEKNDSYKFAANDYEEIVDSYGKCLVFGHETVHDFVDGKWENTQAGGISLSVIWGNHDVCYADSAGGGLFLAASDPVPVYE